MGRRFAAKGRALKVTKEPDRPSCFFQSDVGRAVDDLVCRAGLGRRGIRQVRFVEAAIEELKAWAESRRKELPAGSDDE